MSRRPALPDLRPPRAAAAATVAVAAWAALAAATLPGGEAKARSATARPPMLLLAQRERSQDLESTVITPETSRPPGFALDFPRRKPGLWEIRNAASENLGMPPTRFCVGEETDTARHHLDRVAGDKGSCTIGPFKRVGITWVAESVCKESRSVVVSQSVASGDFQTQYRIDTLVYYSPPLANNKREDKEAVVARYLGACAPGQRPGDLVVPGMGVLNMSDGSLQPEPAQPSRTQDGVSAQDNRRARPR